MGLEVNGLDEEIRKLKALSEDVDTAIFEEMNNLGLSWLADARKNTPTDTGNLRRSMAFDGAEKQGSRYVAEVYNNADYADHVEFGHRVKVHGKFTGRVVKGAFMLRGSRQRAYKTLPGRIKRALDKAEGKV